MVASVPSPVQIDVRDVDVEKALVELRKLDRDLFNQLRREFRADVKPIAKELQGNIPRGGSPLSGMSSSARISRSRKAPAQREPYVWKLPTVKVDLGTRRRRRARNVPLARIYFNDKRPFSAFSVLETARDSFGFRGDNMLRGINSKFPPKGKGRWVIPQFYDQRPELRQMLVRILAKYMRGVNNRMAKRLGGL